MKYSTAINLTGDASFAVGNVMKLSMDSMYLENFQIRDLATASDGVMLQATQVGIPARAMFDFEGESGVFDISIAYFDETDGESQMTLRVDGVDIGTWTWDGLFGDGRASTNSLTSKIFQGVKLSTGSVVELVGVADGGEPLRIDAVELIPAPLVPEPYPEPVVQLLDPVVFRAKDAKLVENYSIRDLSCASNGTILQATKAGIPARALFDFDGERGVYDIAIAYFDESDGESQMTLRVDGADVGTWTWDGGDSDHLASIDSLTSRTFEGVELSEGSVIELVGIADGGEPLRIDSVVVDAVQPPVVEPEPAPAPEPAPIPVPKPEPAPPPLVFSAADASLLENYDVRELDCALDGTVLQAMQAGAPARASFDFGGEGGIYDIAIAYFDESDGESQMTLRVDGVDVGTWTWDAGLGDHLASVDSLTSRTFEGVELSEGSVIELVGVADGGEPLRVDSVEVTAAPPPFAEPHPEPDIEPEPGLGNSEKIDPEPVMAFSGAEGFGSDTAGGRGGKIVYVTNLGDSGEGSLRWALEEVEGPRIVVFGVEGQIELKKQITIDDPFVTIAGQTAPGEGIVVSGARINIKTHDVIMRGMKLRAGDREGDDGYKRDNLSIGGGNDEVRNIVIDHNSFTWSVDENVAVWGTVSDVTFSNNIIAEALNDSIHVDEGAVETAPHSMGMIVGHAKGDENSENITITKNLFASNMFRNAFIKGAEEVEFTNNFVANYGAGHTGLALGGSGMDVSVMVAGNVYEDGQSTKKDERPAFDLRALDERSEVYLEDNFIEGHCEGGDAAGSMTAHGYMDAIEDHLIFEGSGAVVLSSEFVKEYVLANAGARLNEGGLDAVDQRILDGIKDGSARIIDSQDEVGGYDVYVFNDAKVQDRDEDGMADWFELAYAEYGFDVDRADGNLDYDNDGYTNVEEYINGLIDGFDLA